MSNPLLAEITWHFVHPWALLLLLLIPIIAVMKGRRGPQPAVVFSSLHILRRMGPLTRSRAGAVRISMIFLSIALLAFALARPQKVRSTEKISESGIELLIAIDVSRSMQVADFRIGGRKATRLQAAKKITRDFVRGRQTDRIGVIAFAGRPYLVAPITLDHEWIEDSLERVRIGLVEDGTAIGSAIGATARRLEKREAKSKVVVLLTDGVNNAGSLTPVTAARLAKTLGIKIYTIAVGTYGNYTVQTPAGPQHLQQEFDEETLKEIARIADGEYFRAQDISGLERIFGLIDKLEKTEIKKHMTVHAKDYFAWFAIPALAFALLSLIGGETFWRRLPE